MSLHMPIPKKFSDRWSEHKAIPLWTMSLNLENFDAVSYGVNLMDRNGWVRSIQTLCHQLGVP